MIEQNYIEKQNTGKNAFIPPRRRQYIKKLNSLSQSYIDHIVPQGGSNTCIIKTEEDENIKLEEENNYDEEKTELQVFGNANQHRSNFTVTPSSQSESSLDRQSNKSSDYFSTIQQPPPSKKRVNIKKPTSTYEGLESGDTSIFNPETEDDVRSNYLTLTGTIKRGKKKGQSIDVQLNISREELEKINNINMTAVEKRDHKEIYCTCSPSVGLHILVLTLFCLPFVILYTGIYSFYIGTLTWYNMFIYFNEEKSCLYKLFMSPILVLAYPVAIVLCTIGLGIYAGFIQISCQFSKWINEIYDIEKGFYGWLCGVLRLSDCSPYEVVILMDFRQDGVIRPNSSTEELSL